LPELPSRTYEDKARDEARKLALEDAGKVAEEDDGPRRVTTREIDCPP
jgi:hypothetical protein